MNLLKLLFNRQVRTNAERDALSGDDFAGFSLAELLRRSPSHDQVHIVDTGAQAREVAIRLTRKWGQQHRHGAFGVVSTCVSGPSSLSVPFNDLAALHAAVDAHTVAIILEPRRGSDADLVATRAYFQGAAQLCRELKILLVLDETASHLGHRETLLCEDLCGIRADIVVFGGVVEDGRSVAAVLARGSSVSGKRSPATISENWGAVAA
ncbi:aminotransferase class III-fold pyridoxal phosphate-dependent enzyme [Pseudomonas sp.]|uniref:aminotransferase class III-fold pyridoxal phosphate-dependent enzyme n=1 Tax=Pseudomonas sp. TaxID=306 RepID=UPI0026358D09|nr:aminotransferase class III-fold pyridoxal phosphate-dependent enzyme [Pseudomonas sp.]